MNERKFMAVKRSTGYKQYIMGDADNDKVSNIDDRHPYNPNSRKRVNEEVSLAEMFKYIERKRKAAAQVKRELKEKYGFPEARVKDAYSIINKSVRRFPYLTNDLIGVRAKTKTREQARSLWNDFNRREKVGKQRPAGIDRIGADNKYSTNSRSSNPYRAYHSNKIIKGFGFEAQFVTKDFAKLNKEMHNEYKQTSKKDRKKMLEPYQQRARKLLDLGF